MDREQYYNNNPDVVLSKVLVNPASISTANALVLQDLVNNYPQSGILQALLACTAESKNFNQASVHFNTKSLYKLINYPAGFVKVPAEKIFIDQELQNKISPPELSYNDNNKSVAETADDKVYESNTSAYEISGSKLNTVEVIEEDLNILHAESACKDLNTESKIPEVSFVSEPEEPLETEDLVNVNASLDQYADELIADSAGIAPLQNSTLSEEIENKIIVANLKNEVVNYHDDTLPYSFLWWLNKTRKEEAVNNQPYASPKQSVVLRSKTAIPQADELQHQYVENIFHVTSVETLEKSTANKPEIFDVTKKENRIIERFIKEEPQIKPLKSDKLSVENKAIKSSEDREEIVTETLAAIYSQQGLFNKALKAYEKLILKFPEKSRYFADKIEDLKKKTNL